MALTRTEALTRRHLRVRRKVAGSPERPRLCIHKSLKHIYAQVIDDSAGRTICFVTTNNKANKSEARNFSNRAWAEKLGALIAERARAQGVEQVVFDRGGYRYHGVVKAFAEAARKSGLKF
ncbi:MAG TPA: 50S ribosomal protein L18 [Candidatus Sumerlaeota bacterium]|nr:50S ribosomal protein L18 [Candidatus Sumerlaeota bacterium]HPK02562.1 50S ribosomal protein L18 [Candidatus Sumerlaeota bacterium]